MGDVVLTMVTHGLQMYCVTLLLGSSLVALSPLFFQRHHCSLLSFPGSEAMASMNISCSLLHGWTAMLQLSDPSYLS